MKHGTGLIAPSLLSSDFSCLGNEVKAVAAAGADWLHLDIMDGHFVPNLTIGPCVIEAIRPLTRLPLDCHLMVSQPEEWITPFARAGADLITIHAEAAKNLKNGIRKIRDEKCKVGVSINPDTSTKAIESVLDWVDLVLVMSVFPGFGGQKFIPSVLKKISHLAKIRGNRKFLIEIDGGIKADNIGLARKAGCDVFVAGSAVFSGQNYKKTISALRRGMLK